MSYHIIQIDNPAKITVDKKRLKINEETIPFSSCSVLILNHYQIIFSHGAISKLLENGCVIIFTDEKHIPIGLTIPFQINNLGARIPHLQAKLIGTQQTKDWWAQIVKVKIANQSYVLKHIDKENTSIYLNLTKLSTIVKPGDKSNYEAYAAKLFWGSYFVIVQGGGFREKQNAKQILNQCLNYGYSIVRSLTARALVSYGFCLNFGLGHSRLDNPYNLVEDFTEVLRYIPELAVYNYFKNNQPTILDVNAKKIITEYILNTDITLQNKKYRLIPGTIEIAKKFSHAIDNDDSLVLPEVDGIEGNKYKNDASFKPRQ